MASPLPGSRTPHCRVREEHLLLPEEVGSTRSISQPQGGSGDTAPLCFPMGSEHAEQPGSRASGSGPAPKPTRRTPRPQRFWHALFSLPRGPMHELRSVCRLSYCGWPPIHPKFWRGDAPDYGAYVALLCTAHKAARTNRGGGRMAREEVGGRSRKRDLCSACRGASDAKSILIIAGRDRSELPS